MSNIGAQWSYPFGQSYLREQCIAQTVLRTCLKLLKKSSLKYPLPIYCLIFFVTTTILPPTSLHTEIQTYKLIYMLWLNFILGLNFIFFCFKFIIYYTSPYPKTYLP